MKHIAICILRAKTVNVVFPNFSCCNDNHFLMCTNHIGFPVVIIISTKTLTLSSHIILDRQGHRDDLIDDVLGHVQLLQCRNQNLRHNTELRFSREAAAVSSAVRVSHGVTRVLVRTAERHSQEASLVILQLVHVAADKESLRAVIGGQLLVEQINDSLNGSLAAGAIEQRFGGGALLGFTYGI